MSSKRDYAAVSYSDTEDAPPVQPSNKRPRNQPQSRQGKGKGQEAKTDLTYGQRFAFPGLDDTIDPDDDDLEFEDQGDALAYLQSVRDEANGIPHLLVAPKAGPQLPAHPGKDGIDRSLYYDGIGDSRGYYQDGAYTAAPDPASSDDISDGEYDDQEIDSTARLGRKKGLSAVAELQESYFASLITRFTLLRTRLRTAPPAQVLAALPPNHETEVGTFGAKSRTFKKWTERLRYTDPIPSQVAAMDRQSTLRLLRIILGGKFLRRGIELRERTSRWIWALLARLPDRGELDHVEVGWVRELGKRAVLMMVSIAQMAALRDEVEGDLDGELLDDPDEDHELAEEFMDEMCSNEDEDAGHQATTVARADRVNPTTGEKVEDDGEQDMDLELEDGEVPDEPSASSHHDTDIEAVKARLLAQLDAVDESEETIQDRTPDDTAEGSSAVDANGAVVYDSTRARINMRTTLNMILTVAGEFYGQRDLLEFRDLYTGL